MRLMAMFLAWFLLTFNYANAAESKYITQVHRLSDQTMDVDNPSWSPDKKWLAVSNIKFVQAEFDELWLFNTEDGNKRKLLGADQLAKFGTYGYSIWDIKWINNDSISFVLHDNDVDSYLITLSLKSPAHFKQTLRDPDREIFKEMPAELKKYLAQYYPEDSKQKNDLEENFYFFQFDCFGGKWYVQYLRDSELLVIDMIFPQKNGQLG